MADTITIDTFRPLEGTPFLLHAPGEPPLETSLVEVRSVGDPPANGREPFALVFRAAAGRLLAQATYRFAHAELGELDIFVVPVAQTSDGVDYEAIFT
jgi:hypothetical protein